jgi:hypothetical protein
MFYWSPVRVSKLTHFDTRRDIVSFMADLHQLERILQGVGIFGSVRIPL